jgi:hypothetical protein
MVTCSYDTVFCPLVILRRSHIKSALQLFLEYAILFIMLIHNLAIGRRRKPGNLFEIMIEYRKIVEADHLRHCGYLEHGVILQ